MIENRLSQSATRSGTNNIEMMPVGDYRRGGCSLHSSDTLLSGRLLLDLSKIFFISSFTSGGPEPSQSPGWTGGVPKLDLCCWKHWPHPHPSHSSRQNLNFKFQAGVVGGGQRCSYSCRDACCATPSNHRQRCESPRPFLWKKMGLNCLCNQAVCLQVILALSITATLQIKTTEKSTVLSSL